MIRTALTLAFAMTLVGPAFALEPIEDPIAEPVEKGDVTVRLEPVAEGLAAPTDLTPVPGSPGKLLLLDQPGRAYFIVDGERMSEPALDIRDRVVELMDSFDERGLLGVAFHPGFADESSPGHRKLYAYFSAPYEEGAADFPVEDMDGEGPPNHQGVVAEWKISASDPNTIAPDSYRELMRIDQPQWNHDGGSLVFGPDGFLYLSLGDGGDANDYAPGHVPGGNGQHPANILGSIIRIDPLGRAGEKSDNGQYSIPPDNPFVGIEGRGAPLAEIWAFGLRNVWGMSFDPETGRLIAADVGQDKIEEVDIIRPGGNYGWPIKEGTFYFKQTAPADKNISHEPIDGEPTAELIDPALQYDHGEGESVTGGYVYRGEAIPALQGSYVFGDWNHRGGAGKGFKGRLFYGDLNEGTIHELRIAGRDGKGLDVAVTAFGRDHDGELYLLSNTAQGPAGGEGQVWKLVSPEK